MRVLIAPQEYKGTLTAVEAAAAIAGGLRAAFPGIDLDILPMADGGPGTADALLAALGGERRTCRAHDPLMRSIDADWAALASGTAVVECASASGLLRLRPDELDPLRATTFGTGELIAAALDAGYRSLIVGLGGSATNDGGAGMAQALGYRLRDADGRDLAPGGAALARLEQIDASPRHAGLAGATVVGATDVTNRLCGPEGASAVYGPQKGADAAAIAELDRALERFAAVVGRDLGVEVRSLSGGGAAGGLGAGAVAFLGARLLAGAAVVGDAAGLKERIRASDVVITGEGRLDGQTGFGKAPGHVAGEARALGRPVICLAGSLGPGHEQVEPLFDHVEALTERESARRGGRQAIEGLASAAVRAVSRLGFGRLGGGFATR
jgi:glycerate kinase